MYPSPRPPTGSKKQPNSANEPPTDSPKVDRRKSVIIVPSRIVNQPTNHEDIEAEETEIAANITVPHEGGWGWVVVAASFGSIFIVDGVAYTFGSVYNAITEELGMEASLVGLINSIAVSLYFSFGPIASALINRFGFRVVIMTGAIICSFALLCTYFSTSYAALCIFYGAFAGIGYCFINLSSALIVGFYFEKLRSLALAVASTGSSVGIMVMFPLNTYLVKISNWRTLTLLHCGLFGFVYFMGMTYKPLLSLTVTKTTEDPTRTVTYLPNLSTQTVKGTSSRTKAEGLAPTATEKLFSAVSNYNFPTAAAVLDQGVVVNTPNQTGVAGPSTSPVSRLTLTAHSPKGGMTQRQVKQVQSMMSRTSVQDKTKTNVELTIKVAEKQKRKNFFARLFNWEDHIPQSRPMYRDDVFFDGKIEKLPAYQKSMMETSPEQKTGLEYQLAVSRAVTTADLQEKKGVCTTATRRVLATMMDPALLKRSSFLMFGISGFFVYIGYLVPYIFIQERNKQAGIAETHCAWFVSVIGFSNALGRLALGALGIKLNPLKLFIVASLISGLAIVLMSFSFNVFYQYICCAVFGFFISSLACFRSMVLVELYGLEKLTNATGMMLLFQGVGCCISTPLASFIKSKLGFSYIFYMAGFFVCLSGVFLMPLKAICAREMRNQNDNEKVVTPSKPQKRKSPEPVVDSKRANIQA